VSITLDGNEIDLGTPREENGAPILFVFTNFGSLFIMTQTATILPVAILDLRMVAPVRW